MDTKNKKKPGETVFVSLLLLFSLFLLWQAYGISGLESLSSPGSFPMAVASVMVLSSLFILLKTFKAEKQENIEFWQDILPPIVLLVSGFIFIFSIALSPLGFIPSAFIFLSCSVYVLRKKGLMYSLVVSAGALFVIYVLFRLVFSVLMPEGIVPEREILAWFGRVIF